MFPFPFVSKENYIQSLSHTTGGEDALGEILGPMFKSLTATLLAVCSLAALPLLFSFATSDCWEN